MIPAMPTSSAAPGSTGRTTLRFGPMRVEFSTLQVSGLVLEAVGDGVATVSVERLAVAQVQARGASTSIDVADAVLTGIVARLSSAAGDAPAELVDLAVREIRMEGVEGMLAMPRRRAASSAGLRLEALDGLDGLLRAFVTDALWFVDAAIKVPVVNGRIDFNDVDVDHVGPDSTLGFDARGVHAAAPSGRRIDLLVFNGLNAPAAFGRAGGSGSGAGDRGELQLRPLVEAMLQAPPNAPVARLADAGLQGAIQRTSLAGELRMGDGALGSADQHVVLAGREQGKNRLELSSPALGQRVIVRIADLAASSAAFALAGERLTTGALAAVVEVHAIGIDGEGDTRDAGARLALSIGRSSVQQLKLARADEGKA